MEELIKITLWAFSGVGILLFPPVRRFLISTWQRIFRREFLPDNLNFRTRKIYHNDLERISEMANYYLRQGHGISSQSVEQWSLNNSDIFRIVECKDNDNSDWSFCGYYSVLPLSPAAASLLRQSKIQDFDLTKDVFLSFDDPNLKEIYIMDLMTNYKRCKKRHCCKLAGTILIRNLRNFITTLKTRNPHIEKVFSIIASENGQRLAERSGFKKKLDFKSPYGWKLYEIEMTNV